MELNKPQWAADYGLQLCGQYYQGFVEDFEAVLSHHKMETVTSYGVRRSRQNASGSSVSEKENIAAQQTRYRYDLVMNDKTKHKLLCMG